MLILEKVRKAKVRKNIQRCELAVHFSVGEYADRNIWIYF